MTFLAGWATLPDGVPAGPGTEVLPLASAREGARSARGYRKSRYAAARAADDTLMIEGMISSTSSKHSHFSALAVLLAMAITLAAFAALHAADGDGRFDGTWDTIISCENAAGALGYSFKFPSLVKDGVLHGEKGTKGKAGWLQLDGKILPDGSARIYADGLVGAEEFAVGRRPAGTQYGYHIEAKFSGESGTGKRVEGRACSVTFDRKR